MSKKNACAACSRKPGCPGLQSKAAKLSAILVPAARDAVAVTVTPVLPGKDTGCRDRLWQTKPDPLRRDAGRKDRVGRKRTEGGAGQAIPGRAQRDDRAICQRDRQVCPDYDWRAFGHPAGGGAWL